MRAGPLDCGRMHLVLGVRASLIVIAITAGCGGRIGEQITDSRPDALKQNDANIYWTT